MNQKAIENQDGPGLAAASAMTESLARQSIPKRPVNEYPAGTEETGDDLVRAYAAAAARASSPSQSMDSDQHMINEKIQAIKSMKSRLQHQISRSSGSIGEGLIETKQSIEQFPSGPASASASKRVSNAARPFADVNHGEDNSKSEATKNENAGNGSFEVLDDNTSSAKNIFAMRSGGLMQGSARSSNSPKNSLAQSNITGVATANVDGFFQRSGGASDDVQNETHNFPGNRPSRLVQTQ